MGLVTPLGKLHVTIDGMLVDCVYQLVEKTSTCSDIDGRYAIIVPFAPNGDCHTIACQIENYSASLNDGIESGEYLELKSFYKENVKLSIGMIGDSGLSTFDYENEYLDDGVAYLILPKTKTEKFVFGVAWLNNCTEENEVQTWFGADPMGM